MRKLTYFLSSCLIFITFSLMFAALLIPSVPATGVDILRKMVLLEPDVHLIAMQTGAIDVSTSMSIPMNVGPNHLMEHDGSLRITDIEKIRSEDFTLTDDRAFHVGFIGFNIRADQSYRRSGITYWPLADVNFRHALVHGYDQLGTIPATHGYIVTPTRSLVPSSQERYFNPSVMEHRYNPGNPFTSPVGEPSTCGILWGAGYTFVDAGFIGIVDEADFWLCPDSSPLPQMGILTSSFPSPAVWLHCEEFVADLAQIGLAATAANGYAGIIVYPYEFPPPPDNYNDLLRQVFENANFDAYAGFLGIGQLPDHLYSLLTSNQDSLTYPGRGNSVGVSSPAIDSLVEQIKYSLDQRTVESAAKQVQSLLYDPINDYAFAYLPLYSKEYFCAFNTGLQGIVRSPGYGADNCWTHLNLNWRPGYERIEAGDTVMIWAVNNDPGSFNPLSARAKHEWEIIAQVYDGLVNKNPYNHNDVGWIATDWSITQTGDGMIIAYTIRDDVNWQDGTPLTAYDIEWCLEFIQDQQIPQYSETWESLVDVIVTDNQNFSVITDRASINLFYDFCRIALLLPRQIWDRPWANAQAVLEYDPTEAYNVAPGYSSGPTPPPTNLFGTGPWIFQFYDTTNLFSDLWENGDYFMTQSAVQTLLDDLFWEVGDRDIDGTISIVDLVSVSFAYGFTIGELGYDPYADFNSDNIVEMRDMRICAYHLTWKQEYP